MQSDNYNAILKNDGTGRDHSSTPQFAGEGVRTDARVPQAAEIGTLELDSRSAIWV